MPCEFTTTEWRPGDNFTTMLAKWLQAVGEPLPCAPTSGGEWLLLAALVTHYGGTPRPGDTMVDLWRKLFFAIGGTGCFCGDSVWDIMRRILDIISPGSFAPGDSPYNLLRKILFAISGFTPVPPPVDGCCLLLESGPELDLETASDCLALESCTA